MLEQRNHPGLTHTRHTGLLEQTFWFFSHEPFLNTFMYLTQSLWVSTVPLRNVWMIAERDANLPNILYHTLTQHGVLSSVFLTPIFPSLCCFTASGFRSENIAWIHLCLQPFFSTQPHTIKKHDGGKWMVLTFQGNSIQPSNQSKLYKFQPLNDCLMCSVYRFFL